MEALWSQKLRPLVCIDIALVLVPLAHAPDIPSGLDIATMSQGVLEANEWLYNEDELDFSTPAPVDFGSQGVTQRRAQTPRAGQLTSQEPSRCSPYTVLWTFCLKKSRLNKLTSNAVQNIDRYPSVFWESKLKSEIDALIREKGLEDTHEPDETQITISVNVRGEDDVPKRFTGLDIRWTEVDEQIRSWSSHVQSGRKLTIKVTFIFKETAPLRATRNGRNATEAQLNERAAIHNIQNSTDEVPVWEQVYDLLECPGVGCEVGPYCWRNPETGIRHAVTTSVLLKIVEFAEKGGKFKEHNDLPKHFRNEILNPASKRKAANDPQISITNIMPGAEASPPRKRLKIPGRRDEAIHLCRDWHCTMVDDFTWKKHFHDIAEITLRAGLTLDRLFDAQEEEVKLFVSEKIPRGIAHQWCSKVDEWVKSTEQES
ncbi:hypothetical protein S7711_10252 [Stachybotrys chartarum IBT 7711]|uniref:Uncharacterized protein n=1 Tax=Stachybotrys chartarum (strain CBS 109288 / IBT 7711) TaxID=1280523 RepID=A0A084B6B6_STACB|nr:hypothetical protein S7711_10252 [Stachybotrys chartarum IBT 7711]